MARAAQGTSGVRHGYMKNRSSTVVVFSQMCITETLLKPLVKNFQYGSQQGDACNRITREHRQVGRRGLITSCRKNRWRSIQRTLKHGH